MKYYFISVVYCIQGWEFLEHLVAESSFPLCKGDVLNHLQPEMYTEVKTIEDIDKETFDILKKYIMILE